MAEEFIKVNGVTVRTSEVEWTDTRANGSKGIMFKTGVFALVKNVKQDANATLYSETDFNHHPSTIGYYLNGVTLTGASDKDDYILLRDAQNCMVDTNNDSRYYNNQNKDNIILLYENAPARKNLIGTDANDQLIIINETYPKSEATHKGQLNGMY